MPKHKKTREQKIKADERKSLSFATTTQQHVHASPTYVFSTKETPITSHIDREVPHTTTTLVQNELKKTAFISLAILFLQICFYLLLKNHLLAINFVRY